MIYIYIGLFIALLIGLRVYLFRVMIRSRIAWIPDGKRVRGGGYIYFFRGAREAFWQVKIGRSVNPLSRLKAHRTANPYGIVVLGVFKTRNDVKAERILHKTFARNRISSDNEWFTMSLDLWLTIILLRDRSLTERIQRWLA